MIDYRVNYAESGEAFSVIASGVTDPAYLATDLTFGVTYDFKIEARTAYGYSSFSESISLLCAFVPEPPSTVITANTNEDVTIAWSEPVANGSPITAYKVSVRNKAGAFTQETVECDGSSPQVVQNRQCTIPLNTLMAAPYNLVQTDSVVAVVVSVNVYGDSAASEPGSGAVIR